MSDKDELANKRVGDSPTIDSRTIYNSAIQTGATNATAAKFVEAIMQAEEELYSEDAA